MNAGPGNPPEVQGGEVDAGGDVVRPILAHGLEVTQVGVAGVIVNNRAEFSLLPWTTTTATTAAGAMVPDPADAGVPALGLPIFRPTRSHCEE